jgi:DNA-directed RNA polymerase II subunit RPB1
MLANRQWIKLNHFNRYFLMGITGIFLLLGVGLQSCNLSQSGNKSNGKGGAPNANTGGAAPVAQPLPVLPGQPSSRKTPLPGQPIPGTNTIVKIDPMTGLPLDPSTTNPADPAASVDPALKNLSLPKGASQGSVPLTQPTLPLVKAPSPAIPKNSSPPRAATAPKTEPARGMTAPQNTIPSASAGSASIPANPTTSEIPALTPSNPLSDAGASSPQRTRSSSVNSPGNSAFGSPTSPGATSTTGSNAASGASSAGNNNGGNPAQSSTASTGYVYDPSTASYRPASPSLPVWNPAQNSNSSGNSSSR